MLLIDEELSDLISSENFDQNHKLKPELKSKLSPGLEIISPPVHRVGGLPITVVNREQAAQNFINHALQKRGRRIRPHYSTSANGQVMAMCARNAETLDIFMKADEILADGMPMVIYSKLFGKENKLPERIATTDMFHDVAELAQKQGVSFYMLGADEQSNALAHQNVSEEYPDLNIVGRRNGYFDRNEEEKIIAEINQLKPDILWVSLGVPFEQEFIWRNIDKLQNIGVVKTSGGLFDFLSGRQSRAPHWMQMLGFEWAYRTALEPKRLGPRYLLTNPLAVTLLFTRSD